MALSSFLPAPVQAPADSFGAFGQDTRQTQVATIRSKAPPYGHRKGSVPRTPHDFGDGGAFPEIQVAQYPLGMGQTRNNDSNAIPIQLDSEGKIKYDVLAKQGQRKDKAKQSSQFFI
ncbi:SNW domain-containing protein 1-like [Oscarella lobularis]|uniref:SNW domain-containing protein 1-like n=1 Tax=Oscarella lobularis TaxID=121494 RepID=UPI00331430F1